ncbi:MAG: hypothetical protein MJZ00_04970 [Paludibacteraceae bacterium]|nr:hypothetical protein [Paludibacteraceae bacterium]
MEKFNFFRIAKTLVLLFGLSSLCLTSCKTEDDENEPAPDGWNDLPSKALLSDGFTAVYPLDFPLKAYPYEEQVEVPYIGSDKHTDKFYAFVTYDSTVVEVDNKGNRHYSVGIQYFKLVEPASVQASEVDDIVDVFNKYYYSEDIEGMDVLAKEKTTFAGHDAYKFAVVTNKQYTEHYTFYVTPKVYEVIITMPDSLRSTRRDELFKIASTFEIK